MRFVVATCGLLTTALLLVNWVLPRYGAPITGVVCASHAALVTLVLERRRQ
jgi:hypothetical protein